MKNIMLMLVSVMVCFTLTSCASDKGSIQSEETAISTEKPADEILNENESIKKGLGGMCKTPKGSCYYSGYCTQGLLCTCKVGSGIVTGSVSCK